MGGRAEVVRRAVVRVVRRGGGRGRGRGVGMVILGVVWGGAIVIWGDLGGLLVVVWW